MAKFDIKSFIDNINQLNGPASASRFFVTITVPSGLGSATDAQKLGMLCETAPLPGLAIAVNDRSQPYGYGPVYKMPWGAIFTDINLTFIGDSQGYVHKFFASWLNSIVNFNNSQVAQPSDSGAMPFFVNYSSTYKTTVTIQTLDYRNNTIITYTLYDAWPMLLGDVQMAWSAQDQVVRIPVQFNFSRWTVAYTQAKSTNGVALIPQLDPLPLTEISTSKGSNLTPLSGQLPSNINLSPGIGSFTQVQSNFLTDITGHLQPVNSFPATVSSLNSSISNIISKLTTTNFNF